MSSDEPTDGPPADDWRFPDVENAELAADDSPFHGADFDTGSDAWWRAQASHRSDPDDVLQLATPPVPEAATPRPLAVGPPAVATPVDTPLPPALTPPAPEHPPRRAVPISPAMRRTAPPPRSVPADPGTPPVAGAAAPLAGVTAAATATATSTAPSTATAAGTTDRPMGSRRARVAQQQASARGRAFAGAVVALLAVLLGVGALNLLVGNRSADDGPGAVVSLPGRVGTAAASTVPSPSTPPTPGTTPPAPSPAAPTATPKALPLTSPPLTTPAPASLAASPPPASAVVAPVLPVTVLNNSRVAGLADRAAARLRAGGWPTPVVGNFRGRVAQTTVYWASGQQASAVRLARQFGVGRVAPRFAGLPGRGLTLVVTRDYLA